MSDSEATTASAPARSRMIRRISAPAPITSARPGCMTGVRQPLLRRGGEQVRGHLGHVGGGDPGVVDALGPYSVRPSASAVTVVTDPASPTKVRGPAGVDRGERPVDRAGDVLLGRRDLRRRRRVVVQVPLGHPDAADVDADRARRRRP